MRDLASIKTHQMGVCVRAGLRDLVSVVAESPRAGAESVLGPAGEDADDDDDGGDEADGLEASSDSDADGDEIGIDEELAANAATQVLADPCLFDGRMKLRHGLLQHACLRHTQHACR
jgi:hypothetical protein